MECENDMKMDFMKLQNVILKLSDVSLIQQNKRVKHVYSFDSQTKITIQYRLIIDSMALDVR